MAVFQDWHGKIYLVKEDSQSWRKNKLTQLKVFKILYKFFFVKI